MGLVHFDGCAHSTNVRFTDGLVSPVAALPCGQWLWSSEVAKELYRIRDHSNHINVTLVMYWLAQPVYKPGDVSRNVREVTCLHCLVRVLGKNK
jgi:hypothetical protein